MRAFVCVTGRDVASEKLGSTWHESSLFSQTASCEFSQRVLRRNVADLTG